MTLRPAHFPSRSATLALVFDPTQTTRLVDPPMLWSEQGRVLGLQPPATRLAIIA